MTFMLLHNLLVVEWNKLNKRELEWCIYVIYLEAEIPHFCGSNNNN